MESRAGGGARQASARTGAVLLTNCKGQACGSPGRAGQATWASGHGRRQVPRPAFPDLSGIHQLERGYLNWTQHCAHSRK